VFGNGNYQIQPIYVDDLAQLAVEQGENEDNTIINAIGPETFTYKTLVEEIGKAIGKHRPIVPVSPTIAYIIGKIIGTDSPCVDVGDNSGIADDEVDVSGFDRTRDGDHDVDELDDVDMGAYEAPPIWYVDINVSGGDADGTSWDDAFDTIQEGIDQAWGGDIVLVSDGNYQYTGNYNIQLSGSIFVRSFKGPENCRIYCQNWGRGFTIYGNSTLDGFYIIGGDETNGGGIYISNCSPTIKNCSFSSNNADDYGGGIYADLTPSTSVKIMNCVFHNNSARRGGGIYFDNNGYGNGTLSMCTFYSNESQSDSLGGGGAIYHNGNTLVVTNSILWNNHGGPNDESGEYYCGGPPAINYCDVRGGADGLYCKNGWGSVNSVGSINSSPGFMGGTGLLYYRLHSSSPCVDAGANNYVHNIIQDIIGYTRIADGKNDSTFTVDMGAHERPSSGY